jgi:branched-subunit amino acid ABC-type transport system permease component
MDIFLQQLINGLTLGSIYALVALMWLIPDQRIARVLS